MSSVCISNCVNDTRDPRVPVRATYVNLYKWPESDVEFIKSVHRGGRQGLHGQRQYCHPRVVDSISCRQIYLRSYTFSRKESMPEKTKKWVKKNVVISCGQGKKRTKEKEKVIKEKREKKCLVFRKMRESFFRIFHRLLSCTASVDVVVDPNKGSGSSNFSSNMISYVGKI